jgi:hypothetical protein
MAVTANKFDTAGAVLDSTITALAANVTAAAGTSTLAAAQLALSQAQTAAVLHYQSIGRISASSALTALSLSAANLPNTVNGNARYGAQGSNLANRITTLTTAIAGAQPYAFSAIDAAQRLQAANEELLLELIAIGKTTAATVLSTLS